MTLKFTASISAPLGYRITEELLTRWALGSAAGAPLLADDCFYYSLTKRAGGLIDKELQNKKFSRLAPKSPLSTGMIQLTEERVQHVVTSRVKDGLVPKDVLELLGCFFGKVPISFAPNHSSGSKGSGYKGQLLMFSSGYKTRISAVNGQAPCAVLQFESQPFPHLKLETAYWVQAPKMKALVASALR